MADYRRNKVKYSQSPCAAATKGQVFNPENVAKRMGVFWTAMRMAFETAISEPHNQPK